jgi:hypothetical protein
LRAGAKASIFRAGSDGAGRCEKQVDLAFTREDRGGLPTRTPLAAPRAFLRRRYTKDLAGVDLAVTGVPFDQAVTHRPGTRFGPRAIREASSLQPFDPPYGWGYDPLSSFAIVDTGSGLRLRARGGVPGRAARPCGGHPGERRRAQ